MLRSVNDLRGLPLRATDGEIGRVNDFLFDDRSWAVRYMVVDTGGWLPGRQVLISPAALGEVDWGAGWFPVNLTREQVENSPVLDTDAPVSREQEMELNRYFGWPYYWGGTYLWGGGLYPVAAAGVAAGVVPDVEPQPEEPAEPRRETHLQSAREVEGYHLHATDGEIGHVEDFLAEDRTWAVRYLVVDTRNWWPGKKVLLTPEWIREVSWPESLVYVELARDQIRGAPEWNPLEPLTREYEEVLHAHYGRPPYWLAGEAETGPGA